MLYDDLSKFIAILHTSIHPFIPLISEEIWQKLGNNKLCISAKWPETQQYIEEDVIKMPIQINGKTRSLIDVVSNEDKDVIMKRVMLDPKIIKNVENKRILKTIFVPNTIINMVLK